MRGCRVCAFNKMHIISLTAQLNTIIMCQNHSTTKNHIVWLKFRLKRTILMHIKYQKLKKLQCGVQFYGIYSAQQFTLQTTSSSSLPSLNHNSHTSSIYIIPQNYTPDNNLLTSNILYSSTFYYSTVNFNKTLYDLVLWSNSDTL